LTVSGKIEQLPIAKLKGYDKNARTHSPAQVEQLANAIREFGFTNPLLIDERNEIVAGHGRLSAATLLGMAKVPCIRVTDLSEAQIKALRISDNQIALNAGWNEELLRLEIGELKALDFDVGKLGFSAPQIEDILSNAVAPEDFKSVDVDISTDYCCPKCGYKWSGKQA
jgi:ParB family transcriptional regulator, chromosome partitioning protein